MNGGRLTGSELNVNLNPYLTPYAKINSKWLTVSVVKSETIKF